jgi:hypothetical protein
LAPFVAAVGILHGNLVRWTEKSAGESGG